MAWLSCSARAATGVVVAALLLAPLGAFVPAASAGTLDETLLDLEQVREAYGAIPALAEIAGTLIRREHGEKADAERNRVREAADAAFVPDAATDAIRRGLAIAGGEPSDAAALSNAAGAYRKAIDVIQAATPEEARRLAETAATALASRPDAAMVETLAKAMAVGEIAAEQALAGRRMERAIGTRFVESLEALRAMDDATLAAAIDRFIAASRGTAGDADQAAPFASEAARAFALSRALVALSALPAVQIQVLAGFYASDLGRAKRRALIETFAAQNDADGRKMMSAYLAILRQAGN